VVTAGIVKTCAYHLHLTPVTTTSIPTQFFYRPDATVAVKALRAILLSFNSSRKRHMLLVNVVRSLLED